jgi:branched-chain amino acid transport system permease protein
LPGQAAAWIVGWILVIEIYAYAFPSDYYWGLGTTAGINALLALGVVILTGYAGQFSLASSAFFGIGAYGSGLLTTKYDVPIIAALLIAAMIAGLVAAVLGAPMFRLRGHFLAMGTLAIAEIAYLLFNNLDFTGGPSGFGGIDPIVIGPIDLTTPFAQFVAIWALVAAATWASVRLGRGREGRALKALSVRELAASSMGVRVAISKTKVFVLGAVFGSVAGSFYAHSITYVNPPPFSLLASVDILIIAIIGGLYSPWGAVIGSVAFTVLERIVGSVLPSLMGEGSVGAGEHLVVAAVLALVLVLSPRGLMGMLTVLRNLAPGRKARNAVDTGQATDGDVEALGALRQETTTGEVVLRCTSLTRQFGGVKALDNVDLDLRAGEILAVIGPNGAGKSTLINLISSVDSPTTGNVELFGSTTSGGPAASVADLGLARTFQTPALFPGMSVLANVLVGAYLRGRVGMIRSLLPTAAAVREERELRDDALRLLDAVGLGDLAHVDAASLSLGHAKKLEVARALAMRPRILLLDEPAAGLNRSEKLSFAAMIKRLKALGISILLVEHDMELVMGTADRIQVLEFGKTLAVGSPNEIQADPRVIAAYLGVDDEVVAETTTGGVRVEAQG